MDRLTQQIAAHTRTVVGDQPIDWARLDARLSEAVCETVLSQMLLPAFAERFRGMTENEIDRMMQSFALRNCHPHEGLAQLLRARLKEP